MNRSNRTNTPSPASTVRRDTAQVFGTDRGGWDGAGAHSRPPSHFEPTRPARSTRQRKKSCAADRLIELAPEQFIPLAGGRFDVIDQAPNAEAQMLDDARRFELDALLQCTLPQPQYAVIMLMSGLVDGEQHTAQATADMLTLPVSTVRERYRDAIEKLRRCPEIRELLKA